jgi:pimeloyl-ACP methyl ester carboxylesterase
MLPEGRKLGYRVIGKGAPVLYFHGTASSRLEVLLLKPLATAAKLQLIGFDRPGYGLSTYKPPKTLSDFNSDVNALADQLGLEQFGVLAWSGGGAFALAYLALNPRRVTRAVTVGAPNLPFDVTTAHNIPLARYIMKVPYVGEVAMRQLSRELLRARGPLEFLATRQGKQLLHGASKGDLTFFSDPVWMGLMYVSMVEAFRQGNLGVKAVVGEHRLFVKPYNLPFGDISTNKLWVWHGAQDLTCRVSNAYAIAKAVPKATLKIFAGSGHCVMFENLPRLAEILG